MNERQRKYHQENDYVVNEARAKVLEAIRASLPPFFRIRDQKILGQKTIYNLLSQGRGPIVVDIGGIKFLELESFLTWLGDRSKNMLRRGRKREPV